MQREKIRINARTRPCKVALALHGYTSGYKQSVIPLSHGIRSMIAVSGGRPRLASRPCDHNPANQDRTVPTPPSHGLAYLSSLVSHRTGLPDLLISHLTTSFAQILSGALPHPPASIYPDLPSHMGFPSPQSGFPTHRDLRKWALSCAAPPAAAAVHGNGGLEIKKGRCGVASSNQTRILLFFFSQPTPPNFHHQRYRKARVLPCAPRFVCYRVLSVFLSSFFFGAALADGRGLAWRMGLRQQDVKYKGSRRSRLPQERASPASRALKLSLAWNFFPFIVFYFLRHD